MSEYFHETAKNKSICPKNSLVKFGYQMAKICLSQIAKFTAVAFSSAVSEHPNQVSE